jgi:hypothetical protein
LQKPNTLADPANFNKEQSHLTTTQAIAKHSLFGAVWAPFIPTKPIFTPFNLPFVELDSTTLSLFPRLQFLTEGEMYEKTK